MKYAYTYVMNTLADWELGFTVAELNTGRYFRPGAEAVPVRTVGATLDPIVTMGGLRIVPDVTIDEVTAENTAVLLLPGSNTWDAPEHQPALARTAELLAAGVSVAAICGATGALAAAGLLNDRRHTSNAVEYLKMVAPDYSGESHYVSEHAVADGNLITASSVGGLLLARLVLDGLQLCTDDTLEAWYQYFATGEAKFFYALMESKAS